MLGKLAAPARLDGRGFLVARPSPGSTGARPFPLWSDALLVALVTVVAFLPGIFGEFVGWDDDRNYLDLTPWRGLGLRQLAWMFTAFHMGHYHPLTWVTLGADYVIWGLNPFGFHLTSLLLHGAAAVTFLHIARRLLGAALPAGPGGPALRVGAVAAALLFAVHPLRVESVVWLSERRDVLSGLFYLLTVLAYLKAVSARSEGSAPSAWRWYGASIVIFVAALLSKGLVVSLPAVLMILDVYPLRRLGGAAGWMTPAARRIWAEKIPFVLLGLAGTVVAFLARAPLQSAVGLKDFGIAERAALSLYGYAFYLRKMLLPYGLSPLYEMDRGFDLFGAPVRWSAAAVLLLAAVVMIMRRRWPALAAVAAAYAITLLPVIGVVQSGPQITADRYTYLACLGWALLAGAAVAWCAERWMSGAPRRVLWGGSLAAATLAVVVLVGVTARQSLIWFDSLSLWTHAVALDPSSARARTGLAAAYFAAGKREEAQRQIEQAVRLSSQMPEALMGLAAMLSLSGQAEEALSYARGAVSRRPHDSNLHHLLGELLRVAGKREEAVAEFSEAMRLAPDWSVTRFVMARTLAELGRTQEALATLAEADRLAQSQNPADPERDRYQALVYTRTDPQRAIAAWDRYLAALTRAQTLSPQQAAKALEALGALEDLQRK
ncbi:MAG: hypothetical protein HYU42_15615 [Candidatus Rokubacteria bacterium]|nr:hypothetical protein [Candidatus Rokubacteria bacterium]